MYRLHGFHIDFWHPIAPPHLFHFQDGVYMDEVVEIAVGAMHLMAKDVSSRLKMKQLNCIPIFVQVQFPTPPQFSNVV